MVTLDLGGNDLLVNSISTGVASANTSSSVKQAGISGGSALTLVPALHSGKVINLDTATGTTITMPTVGATGSGNTYLFVVTVLATSNSHVIQCTGNASDNFIGGIEAVLSGTPTTQNNWFAGADIDTITLNRTTTGSVTVGEWIRIRDVGVNLWLVEGEVSQTGTAATPFSDAT